MEATFSKTMSVNYWGPSLGIRFPSEITKILPLENKMLVDVSLVGDAIIIKISQKQPQPARKKIQQLFEMYPTEYIEEEEQEWKGPVDDEVW